MKQIIIDYDEYLMLEKAVKLVLKIEKACKEGALIVERRCEPEYGETSIKTKVIMTADLEDAIKEIGGQNG